MKKLKILYLITDLGKGGAQRFLIDICIELNERDDVELIIGTLFDNNEYAFLSEKLTIVNLNFQTFSLRRKNECPAYEKLLQEFKPDVIHSNLFLAEVLTAYNVSPDIHYVCHGHDNMVQLKKFSLSTLFSKEKLLNFLEKRFIFKNKTKEIKTTYIANSTHTLAYYKRVLPNYYKSSIYLIKYGFNFDRFYNPEDKLIDLNEPIRLVNIGTYFPKKNQKFFIEAARELKKRGINFKLDLFGDGPLLEDVRSRVKEAGLEDCITLYGIVDNVEKWLHKSHIYVHAAWYEPFGLVFLEAMAAGLPCVTLDGKGNRDLIEQGKNGYLHMEENASNFVDSIVNLTKSPSTYKEISSYCKDYSAEYKMSDKVELFLDCYRKQSTDGK